MAICQVYIEISQSMEIDNLLGNFKVKVNYGDLLDDNPIGIFNTLEKSVFFCFTITAA